MNELISVIIPAYNAEKYIEKCINSLIDQTYRNIEIIIVNDGSTDSTKQIIEAFKDKDSRIKIIHKLNNGVSEARNSGLAIATGNYVGFVDSDDHVKPDFYFNLFSLIRNHDADIAHCGFELVNQNVSKVFKGTANLYIQSKKEAIEGLLQGNLFEPSSCTKLYKREVVEKIKFDQEIKFNEDLLYNIKAFANAEIVVFHDVPLYCYVYNPLSASRSTQNYKIQDSVLKVAELSYEMLSGLDLDAVRNLFYVNKLISVYRALFDDSLHHSTLGIKAKELLTRSNNKYLDTRTLYLKYSLLYFSKLYILSKIVYDKTLGKNKKWDIVN